MDDKTEVQKLREKYGQKYVKIDKAGFNASGLFVEATRNKLLELKDSIGVRQYRFWHKNRKRVKTALIDLQLFIETASEDDIDKVINRENMYSILNALLQRSYPVKPDSTKSKLAQLFIETGFSYLRHVNRDFVSDLQHRSIDDAIQLSKQLTLLTLPEDERKNYRIGVPRI
jgi:hypothetical protein